MDAATSLKVLAKDQEWQWQHQQLLRFIFLKHELTLEIKARSSVNTLWACSLSSPRPSRTAFGPLLWYACSASALSPDSVMAAKAARKPSRETLWVITGQIIDVKNLISMLVALSKQHWSFSGKKHKKISLGWQVLKIGDHIWLQNCVTVCHLLNLQASLQIELVEQKILLVPAQCSRVCLPGAFLSDAVLDCLWAPGTSH